MFASMHNERESDESIVDGTVLGFVVLAVQMTLVADEFIRKSVLHRTFTNVSNTVEGLQLFIVSVSSLLSGGIGVQMK